MKLIAQGKSINEIAENYSSATNRQHPQGSFDAENEFPEQCRTGALRSGQFAGRMTLPQYPT